MSYQKDKFIALFLAEDVECELEIEGNSREYVRERILEHLKDSLNGVLFKSHDLDEVNLAIAAVRQGDISKIKIKKKEP